MGIVIDLTKAKQVGHTIRREQRAEEFKPFDEIIAKQIPGVDPQSAEASRQAIRDKYALIEEVIAGATTPEEIKAALGLGGV